MSSSLDELIQAGHDITSIKYYWAALTAVLFYDYLITLPDEVQYVWQGKKSWVFVVFILNRYLPMVYTIWVAVAIESWAYTYEMCSKTAFIEVLFFVWCTLIAQIILTARIYAITMKNTIITGVFVCITVPQLAFGIYETTLAATAPAQQLPPIHFSAYQLCVFTRHRKVEIAYTAISLLYDTLAFLVIVVLAVRAGLNGAKVPRILRSIVQDTTLYFLVIFTSHFVLVMTLLFARPTIQLLPASGGDVYLPVMIGRLMLSLKKAADASRTQWSLTSIAFAPGQGGYTSKRSRVQFAPVSNRDTELRTDGDIPLGTVSPPIP